MVGIFMELTVKDQKLYGYNKSGIVSSKDKKMLMKVSRSKYNCYLWAYQNKNQPSTCLVYKEDETKQWH